MNWTAIVPFKTRGETKTRLGAHLDLVRRRRLANAMFTHVTQVLAHSTRIERTVVLSEPAPDSWEGDWMRDPGRGLNHAVMLAVDAVRAPALVIHADLPLVNAADIDALMDAAERSGMAIAPDRHGIGTNVLAIADGRAFRFRFGENSFEKHKEEAARCRRHAAIVSRRGLALDCDTLEDLDVAGLTGDWGA